MTTKKINDLALTAPVDTMQLETDIGGATANKISATGLWGYVLGKISGDATVNTGTGAMTIAAGQVTLAKMATNTNNTLLGYSGAGAAADVAIGTGLSLSGNTLSSSFPGVQDSIHNLTGNQKYDLIRSTGIGKSPDALGMTAWWHPAGATGVDALGTVSTITDVTGNGNTATSLGAGNITLQDRGRKCQRASLRTNTSTVSTTVFGSTTLSFNEASFWMGGVMSSNGAAANGQEVFCQTGSGAVGSGTNGLTYIANGVLNFQDHKNNNYTGTGTKVFCHNYDGPIVWNIWGDGVHYFMRVNGIQTSQAVGTGANAPAIITGLSFGSVYPAGGTGFPADFHDTWYRNTAPSSAEITAIEMYANAEYGIPISMDPVIPLIIFDGDSREYGTGTTFKTRNVVEHVIDAMALRGAVQYYNFCEPGATCAALNTRAATLIDPLFLTTRNRNILIFAGGINNAATYADFATYCTARQTAGWTVIANTLPPANGGAYSNVPTFNASIRANWPSYAKALADVGLDFRIGDTVAVPSGASTYYADGLHLNDLGSTIWAGYNVNALSQVLLPNSQQFLPKLKDPVTFACTTTDGSTAITLNQVALVASGATSGATVYRLRVFGSAVRTDSGTESYAFSKSFKIVATSTLTITQDGIATKDYTTLSTADIALTTPSGLTLVLSATGETGKTLFWRVGWELVATY